MGLLDGDGETSIKPFMDDEETISQSLDEEEETKSVTSQDTKRPKNDDIENPNDSDSLSNGEA